MRTILAVIAALFLGGGVAHAKPKSIFRAMTKDEKARFDEFRPSSYMWGGRGDRYSAIMYIDAERCEVFVFGMRVA